MMKFIAVFTKGTMTGVTTKREEWTFEAASVRGAKMKASNRVGFVSVSDTLRIKSADGQQIDVKSNEQWLYGATEYPAACDPQPTETQPIDDEINYEGHQVGDVIKSYDFKDMTSHMVAEIVQVDKVNGVYQVRCLESHSGSKRFDADRLGHTFYVPFKMMLEFKDRIVLVPDTRLMTHSYFNGSGELTNILDTYIDDIVICDAKNKPAGYVFSSWYNIPENKMVCVKPSEKLLARAAEVMGYPIVSLMPRGNGKGEIRLVGTFQTDLPGFSHSAVLGDLVENDSDKLRGVYKVQA